MNDRDAYTVSDTIARGGVGKTILVLSQNAFSGTPVEGNTIRPLGNSDWEQYFDEHMALCIQPDTWNKQEYSSLTFERQEKTMAKFEYDELPIRFGMIGHVERDKTTLTAAIRQAGMKSVVEKMKHEAIDNTSEERVYSIAFTRHVEYAADAWHYAHIDCSEHRDYTKNMITDVAPIDNAFSIVRGYGGPKWQTCEPALFAKPVTFHPEAVSIANINIGNTGMWFGSLGQAPGERNPDSIGWSLEWMEPIMYANEQKEQVIAYIIHSHTDNQYNRRARILGTIIKKRRKQLSILRADLATQLGTDNEWLILLENGLVLVSDISEEIIDSLARKLCLDRLALQVISKLSDEDFSLVEGEITLCINDEYISLSLWK